jgi:hypothetical protein
MEIREPAAFAVDVPEGRLAGASGRYVKRLRELEGLYGDPRAFEAALQRDADSVVYEVTEFRPTDAGGDLLFGVTRMEAGRIGDEFLATRGLSTPVPIDPRSTMASPDTGSYSWNRPMARRAPSRSLRARSATCRLTGSIAR